ncbi:hypothetical protein D9M73_204490 [compost metagenome]
MSPALKLAGGVVKPPLYAGMVPSALPAFSAPTWVNWFPSFAASEASTAAWAGPVRAIAREAAIRV